MIVFVGISENNQIKIILLGMTPCLYAQKLEMVGAWRAKPKP